MFLTSRVVTASGLCLSSLLPLLAHAAEPPVSLEQMWQLVQQQQQEIQQLKQQLQRTDQQSRQTAEQVEAVAVSVESGGAASAGQASRVHLGGYGELHYNRLDNSRDGGADKRELDFHRFVLFFGYDFNERLKFFSELELEHSLSGDGKPGEVELEQAYLDFSLSPQLTARAGLFILPLGLINETHEPDTFYGVERNPVENQIIPTTWWEGGAALIGRPAPGLQYDLALHSGLKTDSYNIRGGRQKVASAKANRLAATGRLKYTGVTGLELAASLNYQDDLAQGAGPEKVSALLSEAHVAYQYQGFGLRALYARWDLSSDGAAAAGKDQQFGWYLEPSYKINERWGVFARYNVWDTGGTAADTEYRQVDVGVNYWPHPNVVVKLDYQQQDAPAGKDEFDGVNLGLGYQF